MIYRVLMKVQSQIVVYRYLRDDSQTVTLLSVSCVSRLLLSQEREYSQIRSPRSHVPHLFIHLQTIQSTFIHHNVCYFVLFRLFINGNLCIVKYTVEKNLTFNLSVLGKSLTSGRKHYLTYFFILGLSFKVHS